MTNKTKPKSTHFKYMCRICQVQHMQPILQEDPPKTPIPRCCGRDRDMAYQGVTTLKEDHRG